MTLVVSTEGVPQRSIRQRSIGSYELRVFTGTDPATGRRCYRSKTVRGNRAEAERELATMVDIAGRGPTFGARTTVKLLECRYAVASHGWAPTTVRQTRLVLNRQLLPHLGAVMVGDLTTADIDTLYVSLRANGSIAGQPLAAGTIKRVHVVLRSALAQAMRWGWIWTTQPNEHTASLRCMSGNARGAHRAIARGRQ